MDSAKVIALHAPNQRAVMSLGYHDETVAPGLPVIAIPTTAGTGSETNTYGVITDESVGRKGYVGHESVLPRVAVLDPELTLGLPPGPTAATGVDALTHSLESLLSRNPNPFAEAIALGTVRAVAALAADRVSTTARTSRRAAGCCSPPTTRASASRAGPASARSMRSATRSGPAAGSPTAPRSRP